MKKRTFYYSDLETDDFAGTHIKKRQIGKDYKYFPKNPFRLIWRFFFYRVIAIPVVFLLQKITFHEKYVGREKMKPYRKNGFFMYGNHTRLMGDAFCPQLICHPKKSCVLVNPDAVSIPFVRFIVEDLGGFPLPSADGTDGLKHFLNAMKKHAQKNHIVAIYPEARIWPLYTGVRPFSDSSFRFPAQENKPMFTYTTTYHKRKHGDKIKTVVYIDGPFFPKAELSVKENQKYLRDIAFATMTERSKLSTYSFNDYIYKEKKDD